MAPRETISVVIVTYNCASYLAAAIDSVLNQSRPADEIIVVDDGSTDETQHVLEQYSGQVINIKRTNGGCAAARNTGIARATCEWIGLLDSDDVWEPDKLQRQIDAVADDSEVVCVHTNYYRFGERREENAPAPVFVEGRHSAEIFLKGEGWVCPSSALFRKAVKSVFEEWAPPAEDICFFSELTFEGTFRYVAAPLVGHRIHPHQETRKPDAVLRGTEAELRWLAQLEVPQEIRESLDAVFFTSVASALARARDGGHWNSYWLWRSWLRQRWPSTIPRAPVVDEGISPGFLLNCTRHVFQRVVSTVNARVMRRA